MNHHWEKRGEGEGKIFFLLTKQKTYRSFHAYSMEELVICVSLSVVRL